MEYGRVEYVTEHDAKAIKKANDARQSDEDDHYLNIAHAIEDILMCRGLEITIEDLNHGRMQR